MACLPIAALATIIDCEGWQNKKHLASSIGISEVTQKLIAPAPHAGTSLGHPSYIWTAGLERRLRLVTSRVALQDARILDIGCGIGAFVRRLRELSPWVYGVDVDLKRVVEGGQELPNLALAASERLPFPDGTFDVVLLHEVIEHVTDDRKTLVEAIRVLRGGGHAVIFCPNRLYPFETHGVYLGRRYVFGNIPLVNYLPSPVRNRLVPHARAYTRGRLRRLWRGLSVRALLHTQVYPGFDHLIARRKALGGIIKPLLQGLEGTPLRIFGLSHLVILEKNPDERLNTLPPETPAQSKRTSP